MKKLVIYLCVSAMMLGLTACGNGKNNTSNSTETSMETTIQSQPVATPATEGNAQESTAGAESTIDVSNGWSAEMEQLKTAIVDALGENYWPATQITPEILEGSFGITPDMYEDYLGEMPMISTNVDTLLIIRAKNDKVEAVEAALNAYRDNLVNDTLQYPMNVGKIQASRIERIGNYVCFVQLGADTVAAMENGEDAVITHCQEQNELVIEIIGQNVQH